MRKIQNILTSLFLFGLIGIFVNGIKVEAASSLPIAEGTYYIVSTLDNYKCLEVANDSTASGANVQLFSTCNRRAQQFRFTYNRNTGFYTITNINSGKCLDVANGGMNNGTNLQQYSYNGTYSQQWRVYNFNNKYVIQSRRNGLVIDVAGGRTANRTNIWMYGYNGTAAQKFKLIPCNVNYTTTTVEYDCSSIDKWLKSVKNKNLNLHGVVINKQVISYKYVTAKLPIAGVSQNGQGCYKYVTIKLPQKVRFTLHNHVMQGGYGKRWVLSNGGILILDVCECGYRSEVLFWEFPDLPQSVNAPTISTSSQAIVSW